MIKNKGKKCKVGTCNKNVKALGFCSMHYIRLYRYGRLERVKTKQGNKCKVEGCINKPYVKNFCQKHYYHFRVHGDPNYTEKTPKMHKIEKKYNEDIKKLCYRLHNVKNLQLYKIADIFKIDIGTMGSWFKKLKIPVHKNGYFIKGLEPWIKGKKDFIAWNKGLTKQTDKRVKQYCEKRKGFKHTKETKKQMSKNTSNNWKNPELAKKMIRGLHITPNKAEKKLDNILQKQFLGDWKYVGDGQVIIGGLCPDFINCNGKKKIIELFGERWHKGKNISVNQTEEGRRKVFEQIGFDMLVIWSKELKNEEKIISKIEKWLND